ncbi:hypothetical protein Pyn_24706 [Prunus yedoensis var. nudiflora]|uniref:Gnk2-homologous domain-containing protein n=1 Tax=Prunus yedoensis var. nudiflora TaxID=2094558 RepID=A0A314Y3H8_PRUYE|nr:hypothetical protein Pyn_24706 [Prunus yedoensis var. nudiflora]
MPGNVELLPSSTSYSNKNVSSSSSVVEWFNQRLVALLGELKVEAAAGGDVLKFAVGNASVSIYSNNISTIYGLAQCNPDLSELGCNNCLGEALGSLQKYCYGNGFGKYANPSCDLRMHTGRAQIKRGKMVSTRFQLFLPLILLPVIGTQAVDKFNCLDAFPNTTILNSTYLKNVNGVLSSLISSNNSNGYGFYSSAYGENSDKVYAIGLCRGDLKHDACVTCLNASRYDLMEACPNDREASSWTEKCKLRYSNHSMHGTVELIPSSTGYSTKNVSLSSSVLEAFNQRLMALLGVLKVEAAAGGDVVKFAVGNASVSIYSKNISTIYGLAQCSPDLSELGCNNCLEEALEKIQMYCYGNGFGSYVNPSCDLYYQVDYLFFDPAAQTVPVALPPLISPPTSNARGK